MLVHAMRNRIYSSKREFLCIRSTFLRAIRVSMLVGIILNLINNPGIFSSLGFEEIQFSRVILTFIVPFGVSTYSSILSNTSLKPGKISQKNGTLKCNSFKQTRFTVNIGQQSDAYSQCKKDTHWKL